MKSRKRVLLSKITSNHHGKTLQFRAYCSPEDFPYRSCGYISAVRRSFQGKPVYQVGFVDVIKDFQRGKIATRLYELLAREACRRGAEVVSRYRIRGSASSKFWEKQVRKGRAKKFTFRDKDSKKTLRGFILDCSFKTLEGI